MDGTVISLLTRDGAVTFWFKHELTASQYAELHAAAIYADSIDELERMVESLASKWGLFVEVEACA